MADFRPIAATYGGDSLGHFCEDGRPEGVQQDLVLQEGVKHQVHAQLGAQVTQQRDEGCTAETQATAAVPW